MLELIRENVESGAETIAKARAFVTRITTLSRMEREFLDMALRDRAQLAEFCARFPVRGPQGKPIPRLPVSIAGPRGVVEHAHGRRRLSAG
jgi:hypothetical protein